MPDDVSFGTTHQQIPLNDNLDPISEYSKAIDSDPSDDVAWFNRGTTKLKLHDFPGAATDLSKSLELYPNDAYALYFRSVARYNDSDMSGAGRILVRGKCQFLPFVG